MSYFMLKYTECVRKHKILFVCLCSSFPWITLFTIFTVLFEREKFYVVGIWDCYCVFYGKFSLLGNFLFIKTALSAKTKRKGTTSK